MKYIKCIIISFSSRCACRILYRTSNRFKLKKNFRYFGINFENTIGLVLKVCLIYSEFIGCLLLNVFFHFLRFENIPVMQFIIMQLGCFFYIDLLWLNSIGFSFGDVSFDSTSFNLFRLLQFGFNVV
jgi:hypothetical protein